MLHSRVVSKRRQSLHAPRAGLCPGQEGGAGGPPSDPGLCLRGGAAACHHDPTGSSRIFAETSEEIRCCLTEVESCFRLLVPLDLAEGPGAALPTVAFGASEGGAPCLAGAVRPGDEEPCCSKSLLACARPPSPPPWTAGDSGEEDEEDEEDEDRHEDSDGDEEGFVRRHGLGSHKYTLDVELSSGNHRLPWAGRGP